MPTRIHPRRRVVGRVGIQVVALGAGGVGLHRVGGQEATQGGIQLPGAEIDEAGAGVGQLAGVAQREGGVGLMSAF